jgi:hypothetical protein
MIVASSRLPAGPSLIGELFDIVKHRDSSLVKSYIITMTGFAVIFPASRIAYKLGVPVFMTNLPFLAAVRFTGEDAGDFLHNQLSNDVLGLADGESAFACYCEPKGRVLALVLICRSGDEFHAVMARELAEAVTGRLQMYVLRAKVDIEVLEQQAVLGLEGDTPVNARDFATVIPVPGTERSVLLMDQKMGPDTISDALPSGGVSGEIVSGSISEEDVSAETWKAEELRQGITWLCPATSGKFLPQWLGFDELGAVNFRKGCYPGQEIVARTRYLGKVKRHPRLLRLDLETCPGPMDKLELSGEGQTADAVAVDCVKLGPDETLLFVVTRMDPETDVEQIDYQDQAETAS